MIRPPSPQEVLYWTELYSVLIEDFPYMQEAITAEWLIDCGFMPDPTEFIFYKTYGIKSNYAFEEDGWLCEDISEMV